MTPADGIDGPGAILDASSPTSSIEDALDDLIGRFDPESLAAAVAPRLSELGGHRGELLLALVEGLARDDLYEALAAVVTTRDDLAPDRIWMALEVLEGTGRIEADPILAELRAELDDAFAEDVPIADLAREIERDPNAIPLAVNALARIEPDVRNEIIAGLGREPKSPALLTLLRTLAESEDAVTREAAISALHPPRNGDAPDAEGYELVRAPIECDLIGSVVGPLDAEGRGTIVLVVKREQTWKVTLVACDVREGIVSARMETRPTVAEAMTVLAEAAESLGSEAARDCPISAQLLIAGAAWLSGSSLSERTQVVLREALGQGFRPRPVFADPAGLQVTGFPEGDAFDDARAILSRRETWCDDSPLARDLADEARLRGGESPLDPVRDPGPFRVLFEGRVLGRIELYRRMLLWSAMTWQESGEPELSRAAMRIVAGLADPQNAVPGYPFLEELMIRSLTRSEGRRER